MPPGRSTAVQMHAQYSFNFVLLVSVHRSCLCAGTMHDWITADAGTVDLCLTAAAVQTAQHCRLLTYQSTFLPVICWQDWDRKCLSSQELLSPRQARRQGGEGQRFSWQGVGQAIQCLGGLDGLLPEVYVDGLPDLLAGCQPLRHHRHLARASEAGHFRGPHCQCGNIESYVAAAISWAVTSALLSVKAIWSSCAQ